MAEIFVDSEGHPVKAMVDEHQLVKITEKAPDVQNIGRIVRGDTYSDIITFEINRYYDGVDLSTKNIRFIIKNGDYVFADDAINIQYSENFLRFSLLLSRASTYKTGIITVAAEIYSGDSSKKVDYALKTIPIQINIEDSLDIFDVTGLPPTSDDILSDNSSTSLIPTVTVTKDGRISTLSITDKGVTTSVNIYDGVDGKDGINGKDGKDGKDGRSVDSIAKDDDNNLIVTYSDGIMQNVGSLSFDTGANFLTENGFGNLRYYGGKLQYYDTDLSIWSDIIISGSGGSGSGGSTDTDEVKIVTFADGTDEEILAMIQAHYNNKINLSDYWAVGDTRTVHLSAMSATGVGESHAEQDVQFVIADFDHDDLVSSINGHTKAAVTLSQKNSLNESGYMNSSNTNSGGWEESARRKWCNDIFYNAIPSILRNGIKQVIKKNYKVYNSNNITTTSDYCFLLSETEIFGTNSHSVGSTEGTQYEYYKTSSNRIKQVNGSNNHWWESSPSSSGTTFFCYVSTSGDASYSFASYAYGVAPCFCI